MNTKHIIIIIMLILITTTALSATRYQIRRDTATNWTIAIILWMIGFLMGLLWGQKEFKEFIKGKTITKKAKTK